MRLREDEIYKFVLTKSTFSFSYFRLPVELSCLISMMPLHSAVASARLRSLLAVESHSWGLIPQGLSLNKHIQCSLF